VILGPMPSHMLIIAAVFSLAGAVKGMTGMGLPTVAMGARRHDVSGGSGLPPPLCRAICA
jgi:uncharacterized membrane protein YfcA